MSAGREPDPRDPSGLDRDDWLSDQPSLMDAERDDHQDRGAGR